MSDLVVVEEVGSTVVIQEIAAADTIEVVGPGPQGPSGTIAVGTVTTGAPGSQATVTNSGTSTSAVFDFTIPKGEAGDVAAGSLRYDITQSLNSTQKAQAQSNIGLDDIQVDVVFGSGRRIFGDFSNASLLSRVFVQTSTPNASTVFGLLPSGTAVNSQFHVWGNSDPTNSPLGALIINSTSVRLQSTAAGTGTVLPLEFFVGSSEAARFDAATRNLLIGSTVDDGVHKLQVNGSVSATQFSGSAAGLTGLKTINGNSILGTGDITISASAGVSSFNTRTGAITLGSSDVTTALGFTPYSAANPSGYISGITGSMVTTALGFTPYSAANPSNFISGITGSMVTTALGFTPATAAAGQPTGGTAGQVLSKIDGTDYNSTWIDNFATDIRVLVKNSTGATLAKGTVVYISGANGANIIVSKAQANAEFSSSKTFGILLQDLANNAIGYAVCEGALSGVDTSAAVEGDPVWLSPTTAGGLIFGLSNKPVAPNHMVYLGVVSRSNSNNGVIQVKIQNGYELDELHDVLITSAATNHFLVRASDGLWKNRALGSSDITTALGFTPYNATNPSNYIDTAGARAAISVTGYATYDSSTGVINVIGGGGEGGGVLSVNGYTGIVTLTKSDIGLSNVDNKSSATIRGEITSGNVTTALGFTPANAASLATVATTGAYSDLTGKPTLFSGAYADLTGKPTALSAFTNDTNFITTAGARSAVSASGSLSYDSGTGVFSYTAPTTVSSFTNDSGYITSSALSPYLTSASAASTYQTQAGMSSYLTTADASTTYQTQSGMSSYLTTAAAAAAYLALSGGALTGNLTFATGTRITGDFTNATPSSRVMVQTSTANSATYFGLLPNGTAINTQFHIFGSSDPANAPYGAFTINATAVQVASTASGTGTVLPYRVIVGSTEVFRATTGANFLIGTTTDNGTDKLQVNGSVSATSFSGAGTGLTGTAASLSIGGSAGSVAWANVTDRPTALSSFTNDSGYITSSALSGYLTSATAASTYQTISGMSSYLTTSSAASTYQTQSGMSSYLTTSSASSTYAPLASPSLTTPTMSGATFNGGYTETPYAIIDAPGVQISPTNGSVQTWTLGASRVPTLGTWAAGQSMTLHVNDTASAYTVDWATSMGVVWVGGSAPALTPGGGYTVIGLWKLGTTIYGVCPGQVA
jgi:hypothetical protein